MPQARSTNRVPKSFQNDNHLANPVSIGSSGRKDRVECFAKIMACSLVGLTILESFSEAVEDGCAPTRTASSLSKTLKGSE